MTTKAKLLLDAGLHIGFQQQYQQACSVDNSAAYHTSISTSKKQQLNCIMFLQYLYMNELKQVTKASMQPQTEQHYDH